MTSTWAESVKSKGGSCETVYILVNSFFFPQCVAFQDKDKFEQVGNVLVVIDYNDCSENTPCQELCTGFWWHRYARNSSHKWNYIYFIHTELA